MKAVVLAAGLGTRMLPLTERLPKCMLPLAGRPLLAYILDLLRSHSFGDVFINLYWHADMIEECIGDGRAYGLRIHYLREHELSGTAGPLLKLAAHLADERFVVLNGDNITDLDLTELIEYHDCFNAEFTIALHREDPGDLPEKSIVDTAPDGRVLRFVEKPPASGLFSEWSSAGIYVVEPSVIDGIPAGRAYDIGRDLIPNLLRLERRVLGFKRYFYLVDIGTPQAYARAEADLLAGRSS